VTRLARIVAFAIALLAFATGARADGARHRKPKRADPAYVEELVQRAKALDLAHRVIWLRLGHWRPTLFGGYESQADAKSFFVSPKGKGDPEAELEATLRALFAERSDNPKLDHPFCRFPARLSWLNARLGFDFSRVPKRSCPRFQAFLRQTHPRSITLVFSSYYLNNPASAFGHTFLRLDKDTRTEDERDLELLDYGIDYSAVVDTNNALIFAFKGLAGLFPGTFRRVPFYLKVREYNDSESRDLWEYELDLTHEEVLFVVAHLWELGSTYFDYFYLDENCSYHVLSAIEVARPGLRLLDRVGWPVIPSDTVKAIEAEPGLVKRIRYRPSNRSISRARLAELDTRQTRMLSALLDNPERAFPNAFSKHDQMRVLDAALDLLDYRYAKDLTKPPGEAQDPEGAQLKQTLLERRAALDVDSDEPEVAPPFREMPHVGHDSRRLGLGSGWLEGRGYYHALDFRLALQDLADPTLGYPRNAAIEFLPMRFRYYVEHPRLELEELTVVRVTSLTPLERFDHTWSWTASGGARRVRDEGCAGCLGGYGELGGGYSTHLFWDRLTAYGLAEAALTIPVHGGLANAIRVGVGPAGGLRFELSDDVLALATGSWLYLPWQTPRTTWSANGTLRWQYLQNFALGLDGIVQPDAYALQAESLIYF
jgi:Domain of unknown function (DUF4105)